MGLFSTLLVAFVLVAPPDPAAEDTRELLDRAATQYETSQYGEAVATYTEAYQLSRSIEDEQLRGLVQAAILYNLAQAHSKAYALDKSSDHLMLAIDLLEKYLAQSADLADQADAERLLEQTRLELARVEEQRAAEQWQREAEADAELAAPVEPPPAKVDDDVRPRKLRIGGYTLVGLGVAAGGLAIGGTVLADRAEGNYIVGPTRDDRDAAERSGRAANAMIIGGAVSAGVLVTVGVALLVAGRKRPAVSPSAWLTPTSAWIAFGGSF